jgi:transcriptional regulator with XRE-family HTH domain
MTSFDSFKLKKDLITARQINNDYSMDVASKQIGISKATLSRIEKGNMPDVLTLGKLCKWMKTEPSKYFNHEQAI